MDFFFFLRRFALKTGCVLNLVLPDMVARSYIEEPNYQSEGAGILFRVLVCVYSAYTLPYRSKHSVK